jgi:hypothetical protein
MMRVKPVDPNAVIRDPHTRMPLPAEGGEVPENSFWVRRVLAGEVVRIDQPADNAADNAPTGREPVTPLTTR